MEFFEISNIAELAFMSDVQKRYFWAYLVIGACVYAVLYILRGVALYTIAKREGFKNRWFAFVPFLSTYYIGVVSDKNNVFRTKAKNVSLIAAAVEVVYCVLAILYYVATYQIFKGGYATPRYETLVYSSEFEILTGYDIAVPDGLRWAGWIFSYMQDYIMYWVQLVYIILNIFVLVAFFRTYASQRYVLFSVLSVLFPVSAIFMFAVRKNRGKNYGEYVREQQQRQYRMYQEYMRESGQGGANDGSQNGSGNSYYGGYQGNPYVQPRPETPPEDPFGGLGSNAGNGESGKNANGGGGDPFDEFKN
ncbi:MAG: hypothetical protein NC131_00555 [Roseburia sp.]|nr:hypothetical protein [Roseburia sp.]